MRLKTDDLKGTVCSRHSQKPKTVPPNTNHQQSVKTTKWFQTKTHCVLGAGEHRRRLRGVFGIPHAAVKINNQLFLDHSEVKTGGNLN